jgi:hypothetical protein
LRQAEERAKKLLGENRDKLDKIVELLLANETVDGKDVYAIAGVDGPTGMDGGATLAPRRAAATRSEAPAPQAASSSGPRATPAPEGAQVGAVVPDAD